MFMKQCAPSLLPVHKDSALFCLCVCVCGGGGGGGGGSPKISSLWHLQVGTGLGPSCLQGLSADDTSRQRVKMTYLKSFSKISLR